MFTRESGELIILIVGVESVIFAEMIGGAGRLNLFSLVGFHLKVRISSFGEVHHHRLASSFEAYFLNEAGTMTFSVTVSVAYGCLDILLLSLIARS